MSTTESTLTVPCVPENAPFTTEQRSWLNGMLAGIFSQAPAPLAPQQSGPALPILYGSQTGNAESLARQAAKSAKAGGFTPEMIDMESYPHEQLATATQLVIITSTYGEGEPPDNAKPLHDFLHGDQAPRLDKLRYAVLGLGDSNYPDFNRCAKEFDQRLSELGAQRLCESVYCDVDFEDDYAQWFDAVLEAADKSPADNASVVTSTMTELEPPKPQETGYSRKNPFPAPILENLNLNREGSLKETRHLAFSLEGSGLTYEAGDALGVFPRNCPALVEEILRVTGFDGDESVPNPEGGDIPLHLALSEHYDITGLSKLFLAHYAPLANHPELNELLADGNDRLDAFLHGRQIIDPLVQFPARFGSARDFVGTLKKLSPRLYSISSSPNAHPGEVHLTVGAVRYETHGRARKGVCSTFLAGLMPGDNVSVFVQPNRHFKPPAQADRPMIMVGPGTGIAPFRAFLQERQASAASGKNWLFFGDQRSGYDFLYEDQLTQMQGGGYLHRLDTAFSRDGTDKVYVQHRMIEQGRELFAWLEEGAHFYVCGDASRMAKDVDAALHAVIGEHSGLGEDHARRYVEILKKEKRYVRDVY